MRIFDKDVVRHVVYKSTKQIAFLGKRFLRKLALCNILYRRADPPYPAGFIVHKPVLNQNRQHRTIFPPDLSLEGLSRRYVARKLGFDSLTRCLLVDIEFPYMVTKHFLGPIPEHIQFCPVNPRNATRRIQLMVTYRGLIEKLLQSCLPLT